MKISRKIIVLSTIYKHGLANNLSKESPPASARSIEDLEYLGQLCDLKELRESIMKAFYESNL